MWNFICKGPTDTVNVATFAELPLLDLTLLIQPQTPFYTPTGDEVLHIEKGCFAEPSNQ